jgi:hypothetical protein
MKRALVNVFAFVVLSSAANALECSYIQEPPSPAVMESDREGNALRPTFALALDRRG